MTQAAEYGRLDFEELLKFLDEQKRRSGSIREPAVICASLYLRLEDSGVWNEEHLNFSEAERDALRWSPGRSAAPSLPFPFSAAKLAAFMIGGMGEELLRDFGEWRDGPDQAILSRLGERDEHLKKLLVEAYRSVRDAQEVVGQLDPALEECVRRLRAQRNEAVSEANRSAAWRERGIAEEERDIRLSVARTSTAEIVRSHEQAKAKADDAYRTWLKEMVRHILQGPSKASTAVWWQTEHDILAMAKNIGAALKAKGERPSNKVIAQEIEKRIEGNERHKGRDRPVPNWETIRKLLNGWRYRE